MNKEILRDCIVVVSSIFLFGFTSGAIFELPEREGIEYFLFAIIPYMEHVICTYFLVTKFAVHKVISFVIYFLVPFGFTLWILIDSDFAIELSSSGGYNLGLILGGIMSVIMIIQLIKENF